MACSIFSPSFCFLSRLMPAFLFFFFCTLKLLPMYLRAHILKISSEELNNDCFCPFCTCSTATENQSPPQWMSQVQVMLIQCSPHPWGLWMSSCSCRNSIIEPLFFLLRRFICLKCITTSVKHASFGTVSLEKSTSNTSFQKISKTIQPLLSPSYV